MPYDGLFSFLHAKLAVIAEHERVSMPYDGLFSFLRLDMSNLALEIDKGVNAL